MSVVHIAAYSELPRSHWKIQYTEFYLQ